MNTESSEHTLSRRRCLGYGLGLIGMSAVTGEVLPAQAQSVSPLLATTSSMLRMTGAQMSETRLQNATVLLGVILDISKELRAIDLGEIEPATMYSAK